MVRLTPLLLCCTLLGTPGFAQARTHDTYGYPPARVWTSVVRLVRVDFESQITERDKESGYLLFEYPYKGKKYPGSAEVISVGDDRPQVQVVFSIGGMPSYIERMMLDKLERKLKAELGEPIKPERKPHKKPGDGEERPGREDAPTPEGKPDPDQSQKG